ncbi:exonuclease domain-containing protein [Roseovarius sp. MMSF_3281]|uniref:exonuclease domain-containing protein n=1 Tax=Roseovarius sp. MMSF_3281 TaxID=3046694 RepID=UPI00273E9527|nr:exonuclease domain-containing protein [Roseovarius sp. MMSF_3281]
MRYVVIDTETTGMDPEADKMVEIAAVWDDGTFAQSLVYPEDRQISFGAMATHHITHEMVMDAPLAVEVAEVIGLSNLAPDTVLVFHNAAYDRDFLPAELREKSWICTYRCALHLLPDAESHSNGALWYELGLHHDMPPEAGHMPHRALFDALMTSDLMTWMTDQVMPDDGSWEDRLDIAVQKLIELSTAPVVLKKCRFGKHSGEEWANIPSGYMQWVLRQDFDQDVKHTCMHWLNERGEA